MVTWQKGKYRPYNDSGTVAERVRTREQRDWEGSGLPDEKREQLRLDWLRRLIAESEERFHDQERTANAE